MKNLKLKKLCAVLMAATLSTSLFIGCGNSNISDDKSKANNNSKIL